MKQFVFCEFGYTLDNTSEMVNTDISQLQVTKVSPEALNPY